MADKENQFQGMVESLLKGMDTVVATKTVVGEPTRVDDTIIMPLVDVTFGVAAGAGSKGQKSSSPDGQKDSVTGMGGMGGKMTPSAVLVIKNGTTKLVNIRNQETTTKILDMIPDILDRFTSKKDKKNGAEDESAVKEGDSSLSDDEAVNIAFPDKKD